MQPTPALYAPFSKKLIKLEPQPFVLKPNPKHPRDITVSKMLVKYDGYPLFWAYTSQDGEVWLMAIANERIFQSRDTPGHKVFNINLWETESIQLYVRLTLQHFQNERASEPTSAYVNQG